MDSTDRASTHTASTEIIFALNARELADLVSGVDVAAMDRVANQTDLRDLRSDITAICDGRPGTCIAGPVHSRATTTIDVLGVPSI